MRMVQLAYSIAPGNVFCCSCFSTAFAIVGETENFARCCYQGCGVHVIVQFVVAEPQSAPHC